MIQVEVAQHNQMIVVHNYLLKKSQQTVCFNLITIQELIPFTVLTLNCLLIQNLHYVQFTNVRLIMWQDIQQLVALDFQIVEEQ